MSSMITLLQKFLAILASIGEIVSPVTFLPKAVRILALSPAPHPTSNIVTDDSGISFKTSGLPLLL